MTNRKRWTHIALALGALVFGACSCEEEILVADEPGTCEPTYECPMGTEYRRGECRPQRCMDDTDCCPGQRCNAALGFCGDQFEECTEDSDCTEVPGRACIQFRGGMFCGYPNASRTVNEAGTQSCVTNGDCDEGRSCVGGRCLIFAPCEGGCPDGEVCDIDSNTCFVEETCEVSCGDGQIRVVADPETMSGPQCCLVECACATLPPVLPGQYGWHAAIAASEESVAVSAYDAVYGDLVVAYFDDEGNELSVDYVDGFPVDGPLEANPDGPRGGRYGFGPDVGEDTAITIDGTGVVHVAYYDRDEGNLKYAHYSGGAWTTSVVDDMGQVGRYTSIAVGPDGNPRIAYMMVEGTLDPNPQPMTALMYAEARTNLPASPADWDIRALDRRPKPEPICMGGCPGDDVCVDLGGGPACTPEVTGCMGCGNDEVCVADGGGMPTCQAEIPTFMLEALVEGTGLFADLTITSTGTPIIAYYDSLDGDLRLATGTATGGFTLRTLDGDDPMAPSDVGQHASVAVAEDGTVGVAYFDTTADDLVYLDVTRNERWVVDDGITPPDLRMVGADASLVFDAASNPAIAYQDPTNIDLLYARRLGDPPMWSNQVLRGDPPPGATQGTAAGFYACQARRGDRAFVAGVDVSFDEASNLLLDLEVEVRPLD